MRWKVVLENRPCFLAAADNRASGGCFCAVATGRGLPATPGRPPHPPPHAVSAPCGRCVTTVAGWGQVGSPLWQGGGRLDHHCGRVGAGWITTVAGWGQVGSPLWQGGGGLDRHCGRVGTGWITTVAGWGRVGSPLWQGGDGLDHHCGRVGTGWIATVAGWARLDRHCGRVGAGWITTVAGWGRVGSPLWQGGDGLDHHCSRVGTGWITTVAGWGRVWLLAFSCSARLPRCPVPASPCNPVCQVDFPATVLPCQSK